MRNGKFPQSVPTSFEGHEFTCRGKIVANRPLKIDEILSGFENKKILLRGLGLPELFSKDCFFGPQSHYKAFSLQL